MKKLYLSILLMSGGLFAMAQSDSKPQASDIPYSAITEVAIAPNPAKDHIMVSLPLPASGASDIVVQDMLGRRLGVYHTTSQETKLNISQWHEGVYLLSANTKDGMVTKRFIKAN
ncbi:T9SS type A sorting domain-containing protein [Polluticoccus soli]|uniref:T9SS type A sorting domain-containing protein n=1 Tax=Polluticoccus soli TaxID=3034150 RepID=UPI0023E2FF78|nr:T9SS type A sorting domain-containing protein [Flavipsychrobacter sp. JY13-12]